MFFCHGYLLTITSMRSDIQTRNKGKAVILLKCWYLSFGNEFKFNGTIHVYKVSSPCKSLQDSGLNKGNKYSDYSEQNHNMTICWSQLFLLPYFFLSHLPASHYTYSELLSPSAGWLTNSVGLSWVIHVHIQDPGKHFQQLGGTFPFLYSNMLENFLSTV